MSDILLYAPPKPHTGWRIWREPRDLFWRIELYLDGRCVRKETVQDDTNFAVRKIIFNTMLGMDEETKEKLRLYEAFNECRE